MGDFQVGRAAALVCIAALMGCATSSYQSAKLLKPGGNQVGGAVTYYTVTAQGHNNGEAAIEAIGGHGISDKFEMDGKISYINVQDRKSFTFLAIPKLSLSPDKLAIVLPAGMLINSDGHAWEVLPGLVYSHQLNKDIAFDATVQSLIAIKDDFSDSQYYFGFNLGLELSPGGVPWAFHPEIGFLLPTGDAATGNDYYLQFGLAFQYKFGGPAVAAAAAAPAPSPAPTPAPAPAPTPEPTPEEPTPTP